MDNPHLPYHYETLSPREIRVVILYPLNENDEIHCELKRVSIDENPAYEAISYAWGDANDRVPISVGSGTLQVTQNLYAALRALSPQKAERIIWADALCINQSDTSEKNHQVRFMREVYARASCVVIWLGPAADDSDEVMDYIESSNSGVTLQHSGEFENTDLERWNWNTQDQLRISVKVLERFFSRPWFSRVWVIQEASVNEKSFFTCGSKTVSWEQMFAFTRSLFRVHTRKILHIPEFRRGVLGVMFIIYIQDYRDNASHASLEDVLKNTIGTKASDPRDRIYAVQNLANDPYIKSLLLEPDYQKPVSEVYTDMAVRLYEAKRIDILKLAGRSRQNITKLPSWVIDWTSASSLSINHFDGAHGISEKSLRVSRDGHGIHKLMMPGFLLSTISTVIDAPTISPWFESLNDTRVLEALRDRFAACATLVQSGSNLDKKSNNQKNLWRVFLNDLSLSQMDRYPPDYDGELIGYPAWISSYSTETNPDIPSSYLEYLREIYGTTGAFVTRQFAMDSMDDMCMVPHTTRPGDLILIIAGFDLPVIVRAVEEKLYEIIGACYVHGYMDGEAFNEDPNRPFEEFVFC